VIDAPTDQIEETILSGSKSQQALELKGSQGSRKVTSVIGEKLPVIIEPVSRLNSQNTDLELEGVPSHSKFR
jgi:hypothetical protein